METYTKETIIKELNKVRGITVKSTKIIIEKDTPIGSKTWGKLDFLINKCGLFLIYTDKNISNNKSTNREEKQRKPKAKERFSMARMVKKAMR